MEPWCRLSTTRPLSVIRARPRGGSRKMAEQSSTRWRCRHRERRSRLRFPTSDRGLILRKSRVFASPICGANRGAPHPSKGLTRLEAEHVQALDLAHRCRRWNGHRRGPRRSPSASSRLPAGPPGTRSTHVGGGRWRMPSVSDCRISGLHTGSRRLCTPRAS